jgi:hypothetical protein
VARPAAVRDNRRADLAQIHIGMKALRWDDAFYREILWSVCRAKSSAELDMAGRLRLLEHMRACGWSPRQQSPAARAVAAPLSPVQRKMWSLWQQLADAGCVKNRRMPALLAFVKRQTQVDRLEWLNAQQEDLVVESLKRWLRDRTAPGATR